MSRSEGVVGRRNELDGIERFVAGMDGAASALAITGPAGVGKTVVWRRGVELAAAAGRGILSARPTGAEASLSFAGLADLLAPVDPALLAVLPPPQRRALDVALLRAEARSAPVDARAVGTALHDVLRRLAADRPTLIAVDDAQWLDEATADALRFALRRLAGSPLGVLVSVRIDRARRDTFELVLPEERRWDLELAPLTVAALHDVIDARLGASLRRPTLVRVAGLSAGNVFYALEIARQIVRAGDAPATETPVPGSVQALVRERVDRLPARARAALLRAAALAVPTTALVPAEDLLPAEEDGLVRIDVAGRIAFEHPLVAAAVYESAPAATRRRAHRDLAARAAAKEERARHLALAADGPDEEVAAALDEAAGDTAGRGASGAAAQLARLALDLTPPSRREARIERSIALAHYLLDTGDSAAARAVLEACDLDAVAGDMGARGLVNLGWILWFEGEPEAGYSLVTRALELARDPELAARAHGKAAWLQQDRDLALAIAHVDAAVGLLDPDETPGPYSWSLLQRAYLKLLNGEGADDAAYRRGCELQLRATDWEDTSPVVGMWPVLNDDFRSSREFYERGLARSRAEGDVPSVQGTLLRLAEIACWTGAMDEADALAAEGVELADRTGSSAYLGSALYARAIVDAHLGRLAAARAGAERILALFADAPAQRAVGDWVLGFAALSEGSSQEADDHYSRAAAAVERLGQREPARFRFQPDHVEAVVDIGDVARARAMVEELERRARALPRPWLLATSARCRGLVLAAQGELDAAVAATGEALEHHELLEMPFERARTLLVHGRVLRRLKQKRRAREALEQAAASFEVLGARLWAGHARDELARVAARRAPVELSATELRVAELAADGLSNPEIAAKVFVSRKTVEANLARAYRKLGISSRAQLDRALRGERSTIS